MGLDLQGKMGRAEGLTCGSATSQPLVTEGWRWDVRLAFLARRPTCLLRADHSQDRPSGRHEATLD